MIFLFCSSGACLIDQTDIAVIGLAHRDCPYPLSALDISGLWTASASNRYFHYYVEFAARNTELLHDTENLSENSKI